MADAPTKPIIVTILSGFLGSGKTTLLCHLLASQDKDRVAKSERTARMEAHRAEDGLA